MKFFNSTFLTVIFLLLNILTTHASEQNIAIAIHGGAGTILKANMTPEREKQYHAKLQEALKAGYKILQSGGSSVDAIQATIVVMEDSPLFNAGKGAVYTHQKTNELDASIMEGKTLNAGAVAGVTQVKNPVKLAAAVMLKSKHVMLSGQGAETFAKQNGLTMVSPDYFYSKRRWDQILKILDESPVKNKTTQITPPTLWPDDKKFGTVGAVALDKEGNLAAATSTGGMTNKQYGRIGDAPIIGAGTYADNNACAISATGHGEYFIRAAVAHDICARVLYKKITLQQAADEVIQKKLVKMGAGGGIVGMSPQGKPIFSFNSKGMYRGYIDSNGKLLTAIFKD